MKLYNDNSYKSIVCGRKAIIFGLYQMECTDRYPESDNQESDTDH